MRVPKRALGDCRIWWQPHSQTAAVRKEIGPKCSDPAGFLSDPFFPLRTVVGKCSSLCPWLLPREQRLLVRPAQALWSFPSLTPFFPSHFLIFPMPHPHAKSTVPRMLHAHPRHIALSKLTGLATSGQCHQFSEDTTGYLMMECLLTSVGSISKLWSENLLQIRL